MGLGDFMKKLGQRLTKSIENIASDISIKISINRKKRELKKELLGRFTVKQLNSIAAAKGISFSYIDPLTGERIVARSKSEKVAVLAKHLSFNEVIEYARKYKIKHKDILLEYDRFVSSLRSQKNMRKKSDYIISEIINFIKLFEPVSVRDEQDVEIQLYQYLKAKLGNKIKIQRQAIIGKRFRVDILAGPCGIELKVPKNSTHLQRLIGQVEDYSEYLDCIIVVVVDKGLAPEISQYIKRLEEMGAIPIVIKV